MRDWSKISVLLEFRGGKGKCPPGADYCGNIIILREWPLWCGFSSKVRIRHGLEHPNVETFGWVGGGCDAVVTPGILDPSEIKQKGHMKQLSTCVHWDFLELPFLSAPCLNLRALSHQTQVTVDKTIVNQRWQNEIWEAGHDKFKQIAEVNTGSTCFKVKLGVKRKKGNTNTLSTLYASLLCGRYYIATYKMTFFLFFVVL